eukprot:1884551-Prorocentrum_lima.AAC.1
MLAWSSDIMPSYVKPSLKHDTGYARLVDACGFTANVTRVIKQTTTAPNTKGTVYTICAFCAGLYFAGN